MAELNSSPGKSGAKRSTRQIPIRVDLTAMVDLAFLLITFFMLTTSLTKPRIMPIAMPDKRGEMGVTETGTMTICLGKNNQALWYLGLVNKPIISPKLTAYGKDLSTVITETGKRVFTYTGKHMMVLIKPADHSVYANLVDALDEINIANVPTYAIVKISPKDIDLLKEKGIY
jgi:biopolymer transport protein ExbD